jgi:SAM-dependent methyltransferase
VTPFEILYTLLLPFEHPLYQRVHGTLATLTKPLGRDATILDVGGRRSNYTIGLLSRVWVSDLPRSTEMQATLDLGATDEIVQTVKGRRSNIDHYLIDDMTQSKLPDSSFDLVVAIEVLEHVEEDAIFLDNVRRVLKPGGHFLMTTPNGDHIPTPSGDHKRHYRREHLLRLLAERFTDVELKYCVSDDRLFQAGLRRWTLRKPLQTALSMGAYFLAYRRERMRSIENMPAGKLHLFAVAMRAASEA